MIQIFKNDSTDFSLFIHPFSNLCNRYLIGSIRDSEWFSNLKKKIDNQLYTVIINLTMTKPARGDLPHIQRNLR
jgi:hypothetical protein